MMDKLFYYAGIVQKGKIMNTIKKRSHNFTSSFSSLS